MTESNGRCEHTINKLPIPPPKTPEELLALRNIRTLWLTGSTCLVCNVACFTDGNTIWCSKGCRNDGLKRENHPEYMNVIKDVM